MYSEMNTSEKTDVKLASFNHLQGSLCDYKAQTLKLFFDYKKNFFNDSRQKLI